MNQGQRMWMAFIFLWLAAMSVAAIYYAGIMTMNNDRPTNGEVTLGAKDAPDDLFTSIHVDFGPAYLVRADGAWVPMGEGATLDILALQGPRWAPVANATAPAGNYTAVAFTFNTGEATPAAPNGTGAPLDLGDAAPPAPVALPAPRDALVVAVNFTVPPGGNLTLVVDFNAAESVRAQGDGYALRPVAQAVHSSGLDSDADGVHDVADWDDDNDGAPDWHDGDKDGDGAPDVPGQAWRAPPQEETL